MLEDLTKKCDDLEKQLNVLVRGYELEHKQTSDVNKKNILLYIIASIKTALLRNEDTKAVIEEVDKRIDWLQTVRKAEKKTPPHFVFIYDNNEHGYSLGENQEVYVFHTREECISKACEKAKAGFCGADLENGVYDDYCDIIREKLSKYDFLEDDETGDSFKIVTAY